MRFFLSTAIFWSLSPLAAFAAEEGAHEALPLHAQRIFENLPITNSMVMSWVAALLVILPSHKTGRQQHLGLA